ncbi:hypothetical protein [Quadrisphaera granulorum]|uniref:hypothetical protein n=1 Tax=Quadrisphaera granulorum TaxID=317664 RepID=UPI0011B3D36B|nr:hypothetical protein [Quadrisphaera granulorum]
MVSSPSAQHGTPHRLDDLAREIHVDVHDLVDDVRAAVAHVPLAPKVYSDLDEAALRALRAGGLALGAMPPPTEQASTWTDLEGRKLFRESVSLEQVARHTGVAVDELLRAVAERRLLSMTLNGEVRLPGYQFREDGAPLAGLDRVTTALPEGLHPVAAMRFLTMPHPDLEVAGQPLSPVEWLSRGLDPLPVVEFANDLALGQ